MADSDPGGGDGDRADVDEEAGPVKLPDGSWDFSSARGYHPETAPIGRMRADDPDDYFGADIGVPWDGDVNKVPFMTQCRYDECAAFENWMEWLGDAQPKHGVDIEWWFHTVCDRNYGETARCNHRIAGYCVEPGSTPWSSMPPSVLIDVDEPGGKHLDLCRMAFLNCCHHVHDYTLSGWNRLLGRYERGELGRDAAGQAILPPKHPAEIGMTPWFTKKTFS
jgi:hypothetical protein